MSVRHAPPPRQGLLTDLEQPLSGVRFCALDLETTGCSSATDEIVEIGAVRSIAGEPDGTLQVFVRPSVALPTQIEYLTGIRPAMLENAEPLPVVLPTVLEFISGCVFVAHNARFDHGFLKAACQQLDRDFPDVTVIDTAKLARRLVSSEVRNLKLSTLAAHFRVSNNPCHRALPDAAACLEVLWALIERAGAYGVTTLPELLELQKPSSHPYLDKARMARDLPTSRGVYLFRNRRREILYIGKATNLRSRVRTYFTSDERKSIARMREEVFDAVAIPTNTDLEACAIESRLIESVAPRHNRRGKTRRKPVWIRLTNERHPRWSVTTKQPPEDVEHIGPFRSRKAALASAELLSRCFGVRTCTQKIKSSGAPRCALYDLGSCAGPCIGEQEQFAAHDAAVGEMIADTGSLERCRSVVLGRIASLVDAHRYEEAAGLRDTYEALRSTLLAHREAGSVTLPARLKVSVDGHRVEINHGQVVHNHPWAKPVESENERRVVARWLATNPVKVVEVDGVWASRWPRPAPLQQGSRAAV